MLSLSLSILLDDDDDDQLIIMCSSSRVVLVILIHSNHHDSCVCVFVVFFVCMYSWKKVNTIHTLSLSLSLSLCVWSTDMTLFFLSKGKGEPSFQLSWEQLFAVGVLRYYFSHRYLVYAFVVVL